MNSRRFKEQIRTSLKPRGLVQDRKIGAGVVFDTDELRHLLPDFEIVRYEEREALHDFGSEKIR